MPGAVFTGSISTSSTFPLAKAVRPTLFVKRAERSRGPLRSRRPVDDGLPNVRFLGSGLGVELDDIGREFAILARMGQEEGDLAQPRAGVHSRRLEQEGEIAFHLPWEINELDPFRQMIVKEDTLVHGRKHIGALGVQQTRLHDSFARSGTASKGTCQSRSRVSNSMPPSPVRSPKPMRFCAAAGGVGEARFGKAPRSTGQG